MSRQFQLYLLPTDATNLITGLRSEIPLRLVGTHSDSGDPTMIESPLLSGGGITRADCLLAPDFPASIKMERNEGRDDWSVDLLRSDVIELTACYFDGRSIKRGRLYYDSGFYADGIWNPKSQLFMEWAIAVFRLAKKHLIPSKELDAYIGEEAERWHNSGGVFIEMAIKGHPPKLAATTE